MNSMTYDFITKRFKLTTASMFRRISSLNDSRCVRINRGLAYFTCSNLIDLEDSISNNNNNGIPILFSEYINKAIFSRSKALKDKPSISRNFGEKILFEMVLKEKILLTPQKILSKT